MFHVEHSLTWLATGTSILFSHFKKRPFTAAQSVPRGTFLRNELLTEGARSHKMEIPLALPKFP